MAALDKLAIRNIRSFDNNISVIQFYSPLTVIVGQNGSGKTTIIECLNYITTGNMPPNTKGGAFIHDPKLVNEKEVKAQVRLRFYDSKGDRYNAVRNLQVTTKKGGNLSMSTLEGLLQFDMEEKDKVGGKRKRHMTISSRCAEIDEEIPRLLGVSTSILENVIFCHQEDSNWPLSEPAKLKTKFDNIFEATRFTKALKHIKDLHKERIADCKADKVRLEGLKEDRSRATVIRERKARLEAERVAKDTEREDLEAQAKKLTEENNKLADARNSFGEQLAQAEALEAQSKMLEESMQVLQNSMTALEESDGELQKRKDDFQKHLDSQRSKSKQLEKSIAEKLALRKGLDQKHKDQFGKRRALEKDQEVSLMKYHIHEKAVQARKSLIRKISLDAGIKGFDMDNLNDAEVKEFIAKLHAQTDKAEREYQALKAELREAQMKLDDKYAEAQGDVKGKKIQLESQMDIIRKANVDIKNIEEELDNLTSSEHELEAAKKRLEEATAKFHEQRDLVGRADSDERIRTLISRLREAEESKEDANQELTGLNAHADSRARLTLKETDRDAKKDLLQSLLNKSNDAMKKFSGREPVINTFERDVERLVSTKDEELSEARRLKGGEERQLQQVEFSLSSKRNQLKEKEKTVAELDAKVRTALQRGDETFASLDALVENLETAIAEEQEVINMAEGTLKYIERVIQKGNSHHVCITCNRSLDDEEEQAEFKAHTEKLLKNFQAYRTPDAVRKINKLKEELSQAKLLQVKEGEVRDLKTREIARLKEAIKEEEDRIQTITQGLETKAAKIEDLEREAKELSILKRNSVEAGRVMADLKMLDNEIAGLQDDLATAGNTRSMEDVMATIEKLTDDIKQHKRDLKTATDERDSIRAKLQFLERESHREEIALRDQQQKHERRRAKTAELETLKETIKQAKEAVKRIEAEALSAQAAQRRLQEELETQRKESDRRLESAQKNVANFQEYNKMLKDARRQVDEWLQSGGDDQLKTCDRVMKELTDDLERLDTDTAAIQEEKGILDADLHQARVTERNLDDNLRYRALERQLADIKSKINEDELRKLFDAFKLYGNKYKTGKDRENEVNGDIQHLRGVIQGLGDQISDLAKDLKTHYNNIDKRFTEQLVKFKVNELANFDLEKTAKAVDAAILKYHSIKMEEINEHIRYLWSKTYQGTDIDTIMIKSDPDGAKGTKSYNYRVCMVKDTVEMDMRGRCSAGQKVLASIIIRLALADSFSTNCGILALDEPTTNLDKDNIDALAAALADLIKERTQSNFQLIVITHDEDFLGRLGQQDVIEYYWRVSRNANQKSEITRHRLA
ncbi:DNA repair protein rad50 [Tilletia horrida]|uniref:DNA repair protein RAD50 n=1 Tax=Tilletia horrida TaxID=155126 RepID=A0AAN6JME0_9BASI|nr:DNA repair protein rad50 [Tilletia horrida]KAK0535789.1 DNA repair protein rad50 [Tilletia horrida]